MHNAFLTYRAAAPIDCACSHLCEKLCLNLICNIVKDDNKQSSSMLKWDYCRDFNSGDHLYHLKYKCSESFALCIQSRRLLNKSGLPPLV